MRVLHLLQRLSEGGGVQIVVRRLAAAVDADDVELHVATVRPPLPQDDAEGVPVVLHPLGVIGAVGPLDRLRVVVRAVRTARRIRPDVVHLHSGQAWLGFGVRLARPRARFVLEAHDAPFTGRQSRLTDRFEGAWARWGGAIVACHSRSVSDDVRRLWRVPEGRIRTFPLAVDTDHFRPPPSAETRRDWRRSHGIPDDLVLAVAVGRFVPSKRFGPLIEAVAAADACIGVVVIGSGTEDESIRHSAADPAVAERAWVLPPTHGSDLVAALGAADILCSPADYEGFGLTLVEGMAVGLPVLATPVGGVLDLVEDGVTGRFVPGDVPGAWPAALSELAADAPGRAAMGRAARERSVDLFSLRPFAVAFTDLYRDAARSRR